MSRINAFTHKALKTNLDIGRGLLVVPKSLTHIKVSFGPDTCPAKGALSSFYVNELPRLCKMNPELKFETIDDQKYCALALTIAEKVVVLNLSGCNKAPMIYQIFLNALPSV